MTKEKKNVETLASRVGVRIAAQARNCRRRSGFGGRPEGKTTWINLGWADGLRRLTSFSVYPAASVDLKKATEKASVEVSQVLGDHLAEARITKDSDTDPILPHDKIATSVWSPGDRRHFALAGTMDLHGDGRNSIKEVRNIIVMGGGVVDAEQDGKRIVGQITIHTNCLVLGDPPDAKSIRT